MAKLYILGTAEEVLLHLKTVYLSKFPVHGSPALTNTVLHLLQKTGVIVIGNKFTLVISQENCVIVKKRH